MQHFRFLPGFACLIALTIGLVTAAPPRSWAADNGNGTYCVVRSVTRLFTSDVEDKPWYNDREMWPAYPPIRSCFPCPDTTCACRSYRTPNAIATWRCCVS